MSPATVMIAKRTSTLVRWRSASDVRPNSLNRSTSGRAAPAGLRASFLFWSVMVSSPLRHDVHTITRGELELPNDDDLLTGIQTRANDHLILLSGAQFDAPGLRDLGPVPRDRHE